MTGRLDDMIALITGSDSGIGQGTAIEFAKEGADVVVHYLDDADGAQKTRATVEAQGRRAIVVQADISDEEQVDRLFDEAITAFGRVDILMNNAGVDASGDDVSDLSTETWDKAIRTNVYGAFFCCRRYVQLRKSGGPAGGKIINVTSLGAPGHPQRRRRRLRLLQGRTAQPHTDLSPGACPIEDQRQQPRPGDGPHAV